MLLYFYRRRLRQHALQELLAGLGVAVAVALVFSVLIANGSIAGSASEVVHALIGPSTLQLRARQADGFEERLLERVQQLPGVTQSAPLLEQAATIVGPDAQHVTVGLAGARPSLALMDGLAHTIPLTTLSPGEIAISKSTAQKLGISKANSSVTLQLRGVAERMRVAAVMGRHDIGALAEAQVAIMPLARLQQLAGLHGRLTRVLIQTAPGHKGEVREELRKLAGGRLDVEPADQDIALLHQALRPGDQASDFFAGVAVLLGFLFALDAMLLTVPERRRAIVDLRLQGANRSMIVSMVLFQALCLGLAASIVGLGVGYALSLGVFHESPDYLAEAFTLSAHTVLGTTPLLLSLACGVLAILVASALPLLDVSRGRVLDTALSADGPTRDALSRSAQVRLGLATIALLALTTLGTLLVPNLALIMSIGLALTCVLAVPLLFAVFLRVARATVDRFGHLTTLALALSSLRSATLRSLVLAATGAVALYGGVALGGARQDLLRGIYGFSRAYVSDASVWVYAPGDYQAVVAFPANPYTQRISAVPGVSGVHALQGGFVRLGERIVWVTGRTPHTTAAILKSQLVTGSPSVAAARLDSGGWIIVSQQVAAERHLAIDDELTLPTPTGSHSYKIAALSTNFGWSPGSIIMNDTDYIRAWQTTEPTALGVTLRPGTSPMAVRKQIEHALGSTSGLEVLTAHQREHEIDASVSEGLSRLGDITELLVLGAILALAAALASSIQQRRALLAELRLAGATPRRLGMLLFIEIALTLGAGCLTGVLAGVCGEVLIDRDLTHLTGFPVASITASLRPLETLVIVVVAVLAVVAVPGRRASRISPTLALGE